jgi:hypothetical protein
MNKERDSEFAFGKDNYRLLVIGIVVLIIGNMLMIGGGSDDPSIFNPEIFSARRITLAPLVILAGFGTVLIAIIKKSK